MLKCPQHLLNYLLWVSKCYSFLMLHVFICSQAFSGKGLVTWRIIKNFQKEMTDWLTDWLIISPITPQSAIFEFIDHKVNNHLINDILLIFKYYNNKTGEIGSLNLEVLRKNNIHKIKKYWKINKPQQTKRKRIFWKKMKAIVRKHIELIFKYILEQQFGCWRSNIVVVAFFTSICC